MKVELLAFTDYPQEICTTAAITCYSSRTPQEIFPDYQGMEREQERVLTDIIQSGHDSVLEHAVFTFAVSGISRVTTHQLVRHRMASYEQQSQRYVDIMKTWENIVIPPTVKELLNNEWELADSISDEPLRQAVKKYHDGLSSLLSLLKENGVPSEDLRYFIPQGTESNIIITMNARELRHFFSLRLCRRAQWEIRELARRMYVECVDTCPYLFKDAGPSCIRGKCGEGKRSCGKPVTAEELLCPKKSA